MRGRHPMLIVGTDAVEVERLLVSGELVCPDCGVELEVLSADPLNLGLASEEGEDWGE